MPTRGVPADPRVPLRGGPSRHLQVQQALASRVGNAGAVAEALLLQVRRGRSGRPTGSTWQRSIHALLRSPHAGLLSGVVRSKSCVSRVGSENDRFVLFFVPAQLWEALTGAPCQFQPTGTSCALMVLNFCGRATGGVILSSSRDWAAPVGRWTGGPGTRAPTPTSASRRSAAWRRSYMPFSSTCSGPSGRRVSAVLLQRTWRSCLDVQCRSGWRSGGEGDGAVRGDRWGAA